MPVEIKELHIRINVNEQAQSSASTSSSQSSVDQIVAESVEQVMDILKKQKER